MLPSRRFRPWQYNPEVCEPSSIRPWRSQSPAERSAYLDQACADDPELRREVESLLQAHEQAGRFLSRPAVEERAAVPDQAATEAEPPDEGGELVLDFLRPSHEPGSLGRLGHYEVLEVLGRGGFGVVLKAFDENLHRVVAIKVLAPRLAASGPARKRFVREARSAAAVRHEHVVGHSRRRGTARPLSGHGVRRRADLAAEARPGRAARPQARSCASACRSPRGWRRRTTRG